MTGLNDVSQLEVCQDCGWTLDDNGDCNCRPEDYVTPDSESFLYVNAYEVTRHFGGHEEGGWYYNVRMPLTSIPIRAISVRGHKYCYRCDHAASGDIDPVTGKAFVPCKWGFHLEEKDPDKTQMLIQHLEDVHSDINEGNIYSVLGGAQLQVSVEDHVAEIEPKERPHYE